MLGFSDGFSSFTGKLAAVAGLASGSDCSVVGGAGVDASGGWLPFMGACSGGGEGVVPPFCTGIRGSLLASGVAISDPGRLPSVTGLGSSAGLGVELGDGALVAGLSSAGSTAGA